MVKRPKALNHRQLRKVVASILESDNYRIIESDHSGKHSSLSLADVLLALKDTWQDLQHKWDKKRDSWKYVIKTTGVNDRWLNLVFIPDREQNEIRVVTRYQDEYAKLYRTKDAKSHVPISKENSHK
jgi:hypothetical protein